MKRATFILVTFALAFHVACDGVWARSTTSRQASEAVAGWLKADSRPLGAILGDTVAGVTPYADRAGEIVCYVVSLEPAGFVIVSADDLIEPIIAYSESGSFDPAPENPLGALVSIDLPARTAAVRRGSKVTDGDRKKIRRQRRWRQLTQSSQGDAGGVALQSGEPISDVRIAALIQSRWSQSGACGGYCYNYYTPNHYPCGCVATAVAQIMLYHQYPPEAVGVHEFTIEVDEIEEKASTRGGDGVGGPYRWDSMIADPWSSCAALTSQRRQAIGALCYDVGIAANMSYTRSASAAYFKPITEALMSTFGYGNAVTANSPGTGKHLWNMVNTNLDARLPVALGITNDEVGHAVIADGYGYIGATLYHHINFGWAGSADAWYNLPDFSGISPAFSVIDSCTYNIYATGSGGIISGRVTDAAGRPVPEAVVVAQRAAVRSGGLYTATSDENGIYALAKIPVKSTYTLTVSYEAVQWDPMTVKILGNKWGVDFRNRAAGGEQAEILFVDQNASAGANDGTSWANAFIDLQDALAAADWSPDVNQVWVADGTYLPDGGTGQRTLSFVLPDAVAVYGGFAGLDADAFPGGETALDQRDSLANPTVLSGDLKANDAGFRNCTDNSIHVVTAADVGDQTILDGFTITGGNANGAGPDGDASGGGMFLSEATAAIVDCTFVRNGAGASGGGLFLLGDASPWVTNCRFDGNRAASGGGIAHVDASSTIAGCVFAGNTATSAPAAGGAIYASGSSSVILANCTLTDNDATRGGGLYLKDSTTTVTNCIAWGNQAGKGPQFDLISSSTAVVRYCNIDGGSASINVQDGCVLDWGEGNIDADPLFADPAKQDWHILMESPCVDAGDPNASLEWAPFDMDGQQRIMDGRIDIGADESSVVDLDADV